VTTWRIPDRAERERDRRYLEHFLTPAVAAAIASMPVAIIASAPLSLRAQAWCWRAELLIRGDAALLASALASNPPGPTQRRLWPG
jgi:hypothetical protein